jgi:oligogalacturonide transport system permease protein
MILEFYFRIKYIDKDLICMKRIDLKKAKMKNEYWGLLFILPWIIGFLTLQVYPLVASFVYSFTDYKFTGVPHFVGLKNYIYMFTQDKYFFQSLKVTAIYTFIGVPARLIFALLIAMVLNMKLKCISFFRAVYYLPSILGGSVAIAILWRFLFMEDGVINKVFTLLHLPKPNWLGSPKVALFTISMLLVWQFGSSMVLFLAGLKQIPAELYEAGSVDGAGKIRMFFNITLPMLSPIIFFNLVMQTINVLQDFTAAFVITNGGPLYSTYLFGLKIYDEGFGKMKVGYASALSWVLFIIILVFTTIIFKSSSTWVHYEDGGDAI